MPRVDFTQFDGAFDADDYEYLLLNAPAHLAAIEYLLAASVTPADIYQRAQRRLGAERQQFARRIEGAIRHSLAMRQP
jgi:hypothetical protein